MATQTKKNNWKWTFLDKRNLKRDNYEKNLEQDNSETE